MTSSQVRFDRNGAAPDDLRLNKDLGLLYPAYKEILTFIGGYAQEWKFYGPRIGWQFKVAQKKKALFYLTPMEGSFRLAFAVRENEKEVLLSSNLPAKTRAELISAKKYPEGYPLRLLVTKESDVRIARLVVGVLKRLRE